MRKLLVATSFLVALGSVCHTVTVQAQVLAASASDPDSGSSYSLRKTLLWYNRYVPSRAVYGAGYADLNRDGLMDVVITPVDFGGGGAREPIRIMINNGSGFTDETVSRLSNGQPGVVHARETIVGDYNGDGWPDIFIAGHGYDQPPFPGEYPQLFLSNGNGTLRYDNQLEALVGFDHGAASADIDHNGSLDILVVKQNDVYFLINDGAGHFTRDDLRLPAETKWKNWFTGEMVDVDRDGHMDVIFGGHEFEGAETVIYWGDASGSFSGARKTVLPAIADKGIVLAYAAEDIDGDGDRDLVISRTGSDPFYSGRLLQILRQTTPRNFADETNSRITMNKTQNWIDYIRLQDINGDGTLDILHDDQNEKYNGEAAWTNNGQGVFSPYVGTVNPAPTLDILDASINEGQAGTSMLSFTVRASQPLILPLSYDIYTDNGTAAPGSDYSSNALIGQAMAATQSTKTFQVSINGDTQVEGNETLTANLANISGAIPARTQARGRILNDDLAGLSIADASIIEGASGQRTMAFVISLSSPMPTPVSFNVATSNGSAMAPYDYQGTAQNGRLIDPGRTLTLFEVPINGDSEIENDETFTVTLSNVNGATVADGSAVGTILNDDAAPLTPSVAGAVSIAGRSPQASKGGSQICRDLAQRIRALELRVAAGDLAESRGFAGIVKLENQKSLQRCR